VEKLDPAVRRLMIRQEWIMQQYLDVLAERVALFSDTEQRPDGFLASLIRTAP
jgi:hypothetical protein